MTKSNTNANFYNLIKNKTIAVVGNGPCEIGKGKGKEIDAHDIVIRFNEFHTKGYEQDYGTRCDVWANYIGNIDFLKYRERPDCKIYLWTTDLLYFGNNLAIDNIYSCINEKWDIIYDIRKIAWEKIAIPYDPTSGFLVIMQIYRLLGNFNNTDFYGFTFLEDNKNENKHHYFKTEFVNTYPGHNFTNEAEFLKEFIKNHKTGINNKN